MLFLLDVVVWEILFGVCRIYGNIVFVEYVVNNVLKLNVWNFVVYILLFNVYVVVGWWDDVVKIWRVMEGRGIRKELGWSWIEVDNIIYEFIVVDWLYLEIVEIYVEFKRLFVEMEEVGYFLDI